MNKSDHNTDSFGKQWRESLEGAEVTPPKSIWEGVQSSLESESLVRYQRQARVYKYVAAVAILLLGVTSIPSQWLITGDNMTATLAVNEAADRDVSFVPTIAFFGQASEENDVVIDFGSNGDQSSSHSGSGAFLSFSEKGKSLTPLLVANRMEADLNQAQPAINHSVNPIPIYVPSFPSRKSDQRSSYWAGLGLGSSTFDPNYQMNQANPVADVITTKNANFINTGGDSETVTENMLAGSNRKVSVNLGMRLGNRMTLEGGVQYAQAKVTHQTNTVIESRYYPQSMALTSDASKNSKMKSVANRDEIVEYRHEDTEMDNVFDFATLPIRAGYILVDKRVSMRLNAGVVTNFYLGNVQREPSNNLATFQFSPGKESSYRDVSFSGQAGFSLGYRLIDRMDFLLEPNYTQSFQSITKSTSNFSATPNGFGLMAGVRYNFR